MEICGIIGFILSVAYLVVRLGLEIPVDTPLFCGRALAFGDSLAIAFGALGIATLILISYW